MKLFLKIIRKSMIYLSVLIVAANMPLAVFAEDIASDVIPPVDDTVLVSNSETETEPARTYTYDSSTGRWNTDEWYYDSSSGTYKTIDKPADNADTEQLSEIVNDTPTENLTLPELSESGGQGSQLSGDITSTSDLEVDNQTDITNNLDSTAKSGDATVISNTLAADAVSGNAKAVATVINNINSVTSLESNQKVASFVTDVMGDVNGDLLLEPIMLKAMLEAGAADAYESTNASVKNANSITNNINLEATSGNAGVVGNTTAGNATSGAADTVANVVNIINSLVAANQSFIGTVNIYGNLNGDILIAPDFIPQLIASNGAKENENVSQQLTVESKDVQSVINNVSLAANSGKAIVADNTKAGDAVSGKSNTNVVIFNMTGHEIVASNSLLVFVNVLGEWIGVIIDAPIGATAAVLGDNIDSSVVVPPDLTIVSNNTNQITNNINLSSSSGNATVAANTSAGSAVSGNVTASANIANISGSYLGLSGWFGMLFINVFGTWHGSLGVNTEYGNPIITNNPNVNNNKKVIDFIPSDSGARKMPTAILISQDSSGQFVISDLNYEKDEGDVLGSSINDDSAPIISPINDNSVNTFNWPLLIGSVVLALISAAGANQIRIARRTSL